jgi:hypothetical protein
MAIVRPAVPHKSGEEKRANGGLAPATSELVGYTEVWAELVRRPSVFEDLTTYRAFAEEDYYSWVLGFVGDLFAHLVELRAELPDAIGDADFAMRIADTVQAVDAAAFHLLQRHSLGASGVYFAQARDEEFGSLAAHVDVVRYGLAFDALTLAVTDVALSRHPSAASATLPLRLSLGRVLAAMDMLCGLWELALREPDRLFVVLPVARPAVPRDGAPALFDFVVAEVPEGRRHTFRCIDAAPPGRDDTTTVDADDLYGLDDSAPAGSLLLRRLITAAYRELPPGIDRRQFDAAQSRARDLLPAEFHRSPAPDLERIHRAAGAALRPAPAARETR